MKDVKENINLLLEGDKDNKKREALENLLNLAAADELDLWREIINMRHIS